jgi:hypothetical protein
MSSTLSRLRTGAGVAVLALALAACGGGKSNNAQPGSNGGPAGTAVTSTTVQTTTTAGGSLFDDDGPKPGDGLFGSTGSNAPATMGNTGSNTGSNSGSNTGSNGGSGTVSNGGSASSSDVDPAKIRAFFGTDLVDTDLGLALVGACSNGDMQACDTLFMDSEDGSKAEAFGSSCGNRGDGKDSSCVEVLDSPSTGDYVPTGKAFSGSTPTDAKVKTLVNACALGSMNSCDALLFAAPQGSQPFAYGQQCGGRSQSKDLCVEQFGLGTDLLDDFLDSAGISQP